VAAPEFKSAMKAPDGRCSGIDIPNDVEFYSAAAASRRQRRSMTEDVPLAQPATGDLGREPGGAYPRLLLELPAPAECLRKSVIPRAVRATTAAATPASTAGRIILGKPVASAREMLKAPSVTATSEAACCQDASPAPPVLPRW